MKIGNQIVAAVLGLGLLSVPALLLKERWGSEAPLDGSASGRSDALPRDEGGFSLFSEDRVRSRAGSSSPEREENIREIRESILTRASRVPAWLEKDYADLTRGEQVAMCILVSKHAPKPLARWYLDEVANIGPR